MRNTLMFSLLAACAALLPSQAVAAAGACDAVVDDTVAEIRAGADGWWNQDLENLVRAAAGSACVKARSERYAGTASSTAETGTAETAKASVAPGESSASGSPVVRSGNGAADAEAQDPADVADSNSWSVGGLTFRSMSGSPTRKPYERVRESKSRDMSEDEKGETDQRW